MSEYRITFGQQYSREPHPTFRAAHPDGWATVIAPDIRTARLRATEMFGPHWSDCYTREEFELMPVDRWWPRGELARHEDADPS